VLGSQSHHHSNNGKKQQAAQISSMGSQGSSLGVSLASVHFFKVVGWIDAVLDAVRVLPPVNADEALLRQVVGEVVGCNPTALVAPFCENKLPRQVSNLAKVEAALGDVSYVEAQGYLMMAKIGSQ